MWKAGDQPGRRGRPGARHPSRRRGAWISIFPGPARKPLTGQIEGGIGKAQILLPGGHRRARLLDRGRIGPRSTPRASSRTARPAFRNEAWGRPSVGIELADIEAGIGRIDLRLKGRGATSF
ncbi:MAG: hypothetical protein MZU84_05735 [Sphingobacterium sp.]|nr:hypothetical protein [Sphingobacterium sp.]